jgi:hypothetical protein
MIDARDILQKGSTFPSSVAGSLLTEQKTLPPPHNLQHEIVYPSRNTLCDQDPQGQLVRPRDEHQQRLSRLEMPLRLVVGIRSFLILVRFRSSFRIT